MRFPGSIGEILQQAEFFQKHIAEMQAALDQKTVEASAGGGMVTVKLSGAFNVQSVQIEKSVVNPDDIEMLQDLVRAAMNEALRRAKDLMKEEMAKAVGGLGA